MYLQPLLWVYGQQLSNRFTALSCLSLFLVVSSFSCIHSSPSPLPHSPLFFPCPSPNLSSGLPSLFPFFLSPPPFPLLQSISPLSPFPPLSCPIFSLSRPLPLTLALLLHPLSWESFVLTVTAGGPPFPPPNPPLPCEQISLVSDGCCFWLFACGFL